jgi:hypothetical protein
LCWAKVLFLPPPGHRRLQFSESAVRKEEGF